MSHRDARLTVHGGRLLVRRIRVEGSPVAHVAKALAIDEIRGSLAGTADGAAPVFGLRTVTTVRCDSAIEEHR